MLRALFLAASLMLVQAGLPSPLAAAGPALENPEKEQYLNRLKKQHATSDTRAALQAQINSLLSEHALLKGYQVGQPRPADITYSLQIPHPGTLQIRQKQQDAQGRISVSHQTLSLYGMDPFFAHRCERSSADCVILHDSLREPLLRIIRQPDAASELARALSYLVRELQR